LRDRAILETLFSTGLRIAELVALNRDQFVGIDDKKDMELGIIGKGRWPRTVYVSERALDWIKNTLLCATAPQQRKQKRYLCIFIKCAAMKIV